MDAQRSIYPQRVRKKSVGQMQYGPRHRTNNSKVDLGGNHNAGAALEGAGGQSVTLGSLDVLDADFGFTPDGIIGDRAPELVIGAPWTDNATGLVAIIELGQGPRDELSWPKTGPLIDVASRLLAPSEDETWFGRAVATAAFDGDTDAQLTVGAPGATAAPPPSASEYAEIASKTYFSDREVQGLWRALDNDESGTINSVEELRMLMVNLLFKLGLNIRFDAIKNSCCQRHGLH